jgi:hypothetical protein
MGFFQQAQQFGHEAEEILNTLMRSSKKFRTLINEALRFGYAPAEIIDTLKNQFQGSGGKRFAKDLGLNQTQVRNLTFDPSFDRATAITESLRPSESERQGLRTAGRAALGAATAAGAGYLLGGGGAGALMGAAQSALGSLAGSGQQQASSEDLTTETFEETVESDAPVQTSQEIGKSYLGRALENINITQVPHPIRNRILTLGKKLDDFEKKGIPYDDEKVQRVVGRIYKLLEGKPKGIVDEETERFEKTYGDRSETGAIEEETEELSEQITGLEPDQRIELREKLKVQQPVLANYLKGIGKIDIPKKFQRPVSAKEIEAFKSSNTRYASYDPETQTLQTLFWPSGKSESEGRIYEYSGVPEEEVQKFLAGADTAVTTGENQIRAWYRGKNPSLGAAFDEYIKQKDDEGNYLFNPTQIDASKVRDKDLLKVRSADKISKASTYIDSFKKIVEAAKKGQKAKGLKETMSSLRDLSDDTLTALISEVESEMKASGKKRFKGGKEQELRKRIEEKAKKR